MTSPTPLFDVNCSILFTDLHLAARPAAARAAGFDAVEFWWPFATASPSDRDVDAFVAAIRDAGVTLVGLNFFAGDMAAGDRGVLSNPERRNEFRDGVAIALATGDQLGCQAFNALYGNRLADLDPQTQDDEATENLQFAAESAARSHATVLLEAVSGATAFVPAALGVAVADPECPVVAISGDYDFQFMIEELAVGAQFNIPYVHVLVNNAYLGLIRPAQRTFDMDYHVQLSFENINTPELGQYGVDHQKLAVRHRVPVIVEVILERITNVAMAGSDISEVVEFDELATPGPDAPMALARIS